MLRITHLLQNKGTAPERAEAPNAPAVPTPASLQTGTSTPAARLEAARAECEAIERMRSEAKRQRDAAIAVGNVQAASDQADQITALERRRAAVVSIEAAARRQIAEEASRDEWKALEQERAAIVRDAGDVGAEMAASAGRSLHAGARCMSG